MDIRGRIKAFTELGKFLKTIDYDGDSTIAEKNNFKKERKKFKDLIDNIYLTNAWFTKENVRTAISAIAKNLTAKNLNLWLNDFVVNKQNSKSIKTIGVVLAGNIPLVGFHDFLCILLSGHKFLGKLSTNDNKLLPSIAEILIKIEPEFKNYIAFTENKLTDFDAIIATGSNNSSRYFDYYFGKYPHIIRKNRNSVAILQGNETMNELKELSNDIFLYFGLGCRNVSKIFVPINYSFDKLFKASEKFNYLIHNSKYYNNYLYNKSILLINKHPHFDTGFFILKEDSSISSPVSVINYEYYLDVNGLKSNIKLNRDKIQCVVTNSEDFDNSVRLGKSQFPELWDYADEVNTLTFLNNL